MTTFKGPVQARGHSVADRRASTSKRDVKLQQFKRIKFVGASPRSRLGCLRCKSKRKKCDEVKPTCGLCQRINAQCTWPQDAKLSGQQAESRGTCYVRPPAGGALKPKDVRLASINADEYGDSGHNSDTAIASKEPQLSRDLLHRNTLAEPRYDIETIGTKASLGIDQAVDDADAMVPLDEDLNNFNMLSLDHRSSLYNNLNIDDPDWETILSHQLLENLNQSYIIPGAGLEGYNQASLSLGDDAAAAEQSLTSLLSTNPFPHTDLGYNGSSSVTVQQLIDAYHQFQLSQGLPLCYIPKSLSSPYSIDGSIVSDTPTSGGITGIQTTGEEVRYLEYYVHSIATKISAVPNDSNYYLNFFLPMAIHDEALLSALISWGAIFLNIDQARKFIRQSERLLNERLAKLQIYQELWTTGSCRQLDSPSANKSSVLSVPREELLKILVCANVLLAVEICAGDVKNWTTFFHICENVIHQLGGIHKLVSSKEEKILALNFAFHDIMGVKSMRYGTRFSIEEYNKVYHDEGSIKVIDSLQGCVGPLFLMVADVIQTSRHYRNLLYEDILFECNVDNNDNVALHTLSVSGSAKLQFKKSLTIEHRLKTLKQLMSTFHSFEHRIINAKPLPSEISYFKSISQLEPHLSLFKLYQNILFILSKQFLQNMAPDTLDIQLLVLECNQLLDQLIESPVNGLLCFAFVVIGFNSIDTQDRTEYLARVERLKKVYNIKNFQRAIVVIQESWRSDMDNDDIYKKLFGILQKFDWELSLV